MAQYDYLVFNDYVHVVDVFQNFQPRLWTMELPEMNNNGASASTEEPSEIKFVNKESFGSLSIRDYLEKEDWCVCLVSFWGLVNMPRFLLWLIGPWFQIAIPHQ